MILKRSSNLEYILVVISVIFLHLSFQCEANKGDDKERLFLYRRSGNVPKADRSFQIPKQFGIERHGNILRLRSNGTKTQHVTTKDESTSSGEANEENGMEKPIGSTSIGGSHDSKVVETEIIVSAFMPLTAVTQEDRSPPPQRSPPPETIVQQTDVEPQINISTSQENRAPSIVASSTITENATSEESEDLAVSSPASAAATANMKVVSKQKIPPPEFQLLSQCGCQRNFYYSLENFSGSK